MGGALRAPGNLPDGGVFHTGNKTAEWNIFVDPWAARIVFRSGVRIRLVPLDATNKVPIGTQFLAEFQSKARTPLGKIVAQVLNADHEMIDAGIFYAWDPLAAVTLLYPRVVKTSPVRIEIRRVSSRARPNHSSGRPAERECSDGCRRPGLPQNLSRSLRKVSGILLSCRKKLCFYLFCRLRSGSPNWIPIRSR